MARADPLCAHFAWRWSLQVGSLQVYGSVTDGYVVAPPRPPHRTVRPSPAQPWGGTTPGSEQTTATQSTPREELAMVLAVVLGMVVAALAIMPTTWTLACDARSLPPCSAGAGRRRDWRSRPRLQYEDSVASRLWHRGERVLPRRSARSAAWARCQSLCMAPRRGLAHRHQRSCIPCDRCVPAPARGHAGGVSRVSLAGARRRHASSSTSASRAGSTDSTKTRTP